MNIFSMFDGVGGFIVGLNNSDDEFYQTLYSNQFEPSKKRQDAYEVGCYHFPNMEHISSDVQHIPNEKYDEMRENNVQLIVGGFPCQDYSVARSKKGEMGIQGKKGVLFWEIIRAAIHIQPKYLILENVDRLLKSPSKQRGRDFGIMLAAFEELDYSVEWRIINAADYGCAQRRRRLFFFVYKNNSDWAKKIEDKYEDEITKNDSHKYDDYILNEGLFARQFKVKRGAKDRQVYGKLYKDVVKVSKQFEGKFWNSGIMRHGKYYSIETVANTDEKPIPLNDILIPESEVDKKYYVRGDKLKKFKELRKAKKINRTSKEGHTYIFSEGSMSPYDELDLPARTMLTSEGTVNRSTHLIKKNNRYRLITPIEAERLQGFPDDWTKYKQVGDEVMEVSDRMRLFFMGNALVTNIVKRIGDELRLIDEEE